MMQPWPPRSADLNPKENPWGIVKRGVHLTQKYKRAEGNQSNLGFSNDSR